MSDKPYYGWAVLVEILEDDIHIVTTHILEYTNGEESDIRDFAREKQIEGHTLVYIGTNKTYSEVDEEIKTFYNNLRITRTFGHGHNSIGISHYIGCKLYGYDNYVNRHDKKFEFEDYDIFGVLKQWTDGILSRTDEPTILMNNREKLKMKNSEKHYIILDHTTEESKWTDVELIMLEDCTPKEYCEEFDINIEDETKVSAHGVLSEDHEAAIEGMSPHVYYSFEASMSNGPFFARGMDNTFYVRNFPAKILKDLYFKEFSGYSTKEILSTVFHESTNQRNINGQTSKFSMKKHLEANISNTTNHKDHDLPEENLKESDDDWTWKTIETLSELQICLSKNIDIYILHEDGFETIADRDKEIVSAIQYGYTMAIRI